MQRLRFFYNFWGWKVRLKCNMKSWRFGGDVILFFFIRSQKIYTKENYHGCKIATMFLFSIFSNSLSKLRIVKDNQNLERIYWTFWIHVFFPIFSCPSFFPFSNVEQYTLRNIIIWEKIWKITESSTVSNSIICFLFNIS